MVLSEKIETKSTQIWIDDEGILHVKIKEGAEVDLEEVKFCFDIYKKLGCHKNKVLQLIEGGSFFTFDNNAQKYAAKHGGDFFIAAAIINNSLAIRMLFNFFNAFFKNRVPFKMFITKQEALKWLRTFRETKKS